MASYNKCLFMGNLTRDPQLSYTPSQTAVVDFGIAVNRVWTDQGGTKHDEVCFVDVRAFGRMAENINKYFTKGKPIFVEGRLTYDTWTAQDGTRRSRHRITVESFQFLPSGGASGSREGSSDGGGEGSAQYPQSRHGAINSDDDIPF